jgi:hypothetical protein
VVRAEEEATRVSDYAALGDALGIEAPDRTALTAAVKRWLETHGRWLLVFDNAEGPHAVSGLIPAGRAGHVLITSRRQGGWGGTATAHKVDVWTRTEAANFLRRRTGDGDEAAAESIADALGDLPLALEQAGAYADTNGLTLGMYLTRLAEHARRLLARGAPPDYQRTVATTWELAFARIESHAGAVAILRCCAFLAPEAIPAELFASDAIAEGVFAGRDGALALDEAIGRLRAYSLVTVNGQALNIHRLVQQVIRDRLSPEDQRAWAATTESLIDAALAPEPRDRAVWSQYAHLLPHGLAVTRHVGAANCESATTASILARIGALWGIHFTGAKKAPSRAGRLATAPGWAGDHGCRATGVVRCRAGGWR